MKLTNPFKGCGGYAPNTQILAGHPHRLYGRCGEGEYCTKCLVARINHLEEQLVMAHCDKYETDTNTEAVIKAGFKQRAAIWSRPCQ